MENGFNKTAFMQELNKFILDNGIIGSVAGVSIALVTKEAIQSLVGDIVMPIIIILLLKLNVKSLTKILPGKSDINIRNFIKIFITWILVIVVTFVFIKFTFAKLLGVNVTKQEAPVKEPKKESFY
jgi:large-conductance mechanosensitive channel